MEPYPSNSYKSKEESQPTDEATPKLRVVPEGTRVIRRRPPMGRRFKETFLGEGQGIGGVLEYVIGDVMIPAFRDMVTEAFTEAVNRMFYGAREQPHRRNDRGRPNVVSNVRPITNYSRYSSRDAVSRPPRPSNRYRVDDIILPKADDVRDVIAALRNDIDEYEFATVRDLLEMVGSPFAHSDERWGWYDLSGAYPKRINGGYLLVLPPVEPRGD